MELWFHFGIVAVDDGTSELLQAQWDFRLSTSPTGSGSTSFSIKLAMQDE